MIGKIPDAEAIVVKFLNENEAIIDLIGENKVSTELPKNPDFPRIRVSLAGGAPIGKNWLKQIKISIEAWANSKEEAFNTIREAVYQLELGLDGALVEGGVVSGFQQETGLSWSPDPLTQTPRYLIGFVAYMHE